MSNIITNSPLLWAGLLASMVVLPILIHLINRLRHRRVRWAAMDFLLTSHKKNRRWVWLKQWLLLAARIAALLLVLLTVGQIGCDRDQVSWLPGDQVTHHYVVVDDSLSMSDTAGGETAMERARQTMRRLASRLTGLSRHRVTIIRFSRAADRSSGDSSERLDELPQDSAVGELNAVRVDRDIEKTVDEAANSIQPTSLATGPDAALELVAGLIESRSAEQSLVYLVSDFREVDWRQGQPFSQSLQRLDRAGAPIRLIRCVTESRDNLAITRLEADGSVRVAGIPLMMEIEVRNFGQQPASKVQVSLTSARYPADSVDSSEPENLEPEVSELPSLLIDKIPAGESVTRRFPVFFSNPGQHAIRGELPADAMPGDNRRWDVTRFTASERVLVIDGPDRRAGKFIALALTAGDMTGLQVELADKSRLRDAQPEDLDQFETIFLLDVDQFEQASVEQLEGFLIRGGGVVFFTGPNTQLKHFTEQLYRNGQGPFPVPLQRVVAVPEQLEQPVADIQPRDHPVFASVIDVDDSPLDLVQVARICQPPADWSAKKDDFVEVLATLRGREEWPLVVTRRFGQGRVIATLTSADAQWNNWLRNPTFPATLLLMQDFVSKGRELERRETTGIQKVWELSPGTYRSQAVFVAPAGEPFERATWKVTASRDEDKNRVVARLGRTSRETEAPGIYEAWLTRSDGRVEMDRFALNVDHRESVLEVAERSRLLQVLGDVDGHIVDWDHFGPGTQSQRGTSLVRWLLVFLLIVLVAEQVLAYSASFHPRRSGSRESSGSVHGVVRTKSRSAA